MVIGSFVKHVGLPAEAVAPVEPAVPQKETPVTEEIAKLRSFRDRALDCAEKIERNIEGINRKLVRKDCSPEMANLYRYQLESLHLAYQRYIDAVGDYMGI